MPPEGCSSRRSTSSAAPSGSARTTKQPAWRPTSFGSTSTNLLSPGRLPLHHERLGPPDAPAVLFLHGITESRRYFSARVAPLAGPFHLVLPDLPGFGLSPKPVVSYSVGLFVEAVRSFVEAGGLAGRPLHLVGHSLG